MIIKCFLYKIFRETEIDTRIVQHWSLQLARVCYTVVLCKCLNCRSKTSEFIKSIHVFRSVMNIDANSNGRWTDKQTKGEWKHSEHQFLRCDIGNCVVLVAFRPECIWLTTSAKLPLLLSISSIVLVKWYSPAKIQMRTCRQWNGVLRLRIDGISSLAANMASMAIITIIIVIIVINPCSIATRC